ncbi:MAG: Asp-tRNA(Asn)/Glu-tRNA(Gln) amidotransferase subunit GatB [Bacteriovoracia bacterium]
MEFEPVIGLEVHAQLLTDTKVFCSCSTEFNAPTNTNICPVCAGHPGSLPVLNARAVEFAIRAGLATNCAIRHKSVFSRKNYFYPDLPKGYQISQYDEPLCEDGSLTIEIGGTPQKPELATQKQIRIQRIHMEEDAGKSVHASGYSLVNLNRAGTPLIEIVSHPDITSAEEAGQYLRKLRAILMYIGVCDGNMQEGSFRCDANISVKPVGSKTLGTRTEVKNVNSFRFVEKAIEYEINRQIQTIQSGGKVIQETRLFDSGKNVTVAIRTKEEAQDYRYFPEPDLITLRVDDKKIEAVKETLPELPDQKRDRFVSELGIPKYDANVITASKRLAEFFENAIDKATVSGDEKKKIAKTASNYVMGELLRLLKEEGKEVEEANLPDVKLFNDLLMMVLKGKINNNTGKQVFEELYKNGTDPTQYVEKQGLGQVSDTAALEEIISKVLSDNPGQLAEYKSGKEKLFGFFVGQVMKQMGGKANPSVVNDLLKKKLSS